MPDLTQFFGMTPPVRTLTGPIGAGPLPTSVAIAEAVPNNVIRWGGGAMVPPGGGSGAGGGMGGAAGLPPGGSGPRLLMPGPPETVPQSRVFNMGGPRPAGAVGGGGPPWARLGAGGAAASGGLPWGTIGPLAAAAAGAVYHGIGKQHMQNDAMTMGTPLQQALSKMIADEDAARTKYGAAGAFGATVRNLPAVGARALGAYTHPVTVPVSNFFRGLFGEDTPEPAKPTTSAQASAKAPAQVTSAPATPENAAVVAMQAWAKAFPNMSARNASAMMGGAASIAPQFRPPTPPSGKDVLLYNLLNMANAEFNHDVTSDDPQVRGQAKLKYMQTLMSAANPSSAMMYGNPFDPQENP